MQRSRMKEGVEYAVRNNSTSGTLYRATFTGDRVVPERRREIGYPARQVDVKYLVFKVEAVITRPFGADPTEPGQELLIESARFVEATWERHMEVEEALGVTVAPDLHTDLGDGSRRYDLPSHAIHGTHLSDVKYARVDFPADLLVRVADMVSELRAAVELHQGWPATPGPDDPDWPGEARP